MVMLLSALPHCFGAAVAPSLGAAGGTIYEAPNDPTVVAAYSDFPAGYTQATFEAVNGCAATASAVPEPDSLALVAISLIACGIGLRKIHSIQSAREIPANVPENLAAQLDRATARNTKKENH